MINGMDNYAIEEASRIQGAPGDEARGPDHGPAGTSESIRSALSIEG